MGVLEDYTRNRSRLYTPLMSSNVIYSSCMIPYSAIVKTILVRTFKTTIKTKTTHNLKRNYEQFFIRLAIGNFFFL